MDNFLRQVESIIKDYDRETNLGSAHDKQALMEALEEAVDEYISNN